jgi:UDP-glucose 4-epimerase
VVGGTFVEGDVGDSALLERVFVNERFDAVMHFAAFIEVGESVSNPAKYYRNNAMNTLNLLQAMVHAGVSDFILSSTAAVYGEPEFVPLTEEHGCRPMNPYGQSKYMVEKMLESFDLAHDVKSICLRYFNAAGAHPEGILGERHNPESHLIPLVLQAASGRRQSISVFGRDYATADGTAVRDYIHVMDLCQAHLLALEALQSQRRSAIYNLGNGNGFSVQQVIDVAREVTGREIKVVDAERRAGDAAILVADASRARRELAWSPGYSDLETIIRHAWSWELKMADGH